MLKIKNFLNKSTFSTKRLIHTEFIKKIPVGVSLSSIRNDRRPTEDKQSYSNRSNRELANILKPNMFYVYVDKSVLGKDMPPVAGHIASFVTNKDGLVINGTQVSLRNGDPVPEKRLVYTFEHEKPKKERNQMVYKVIFNSISEEFKKSLFEKAIPGLPFQDDKKRFLFEFPITLTGESIDTILKYVANLKNDPKHTEYLLSDGVIETIASGEIVTREFTKSFNCINGFYAGIGVKGVEHNPSPQMAAWSYAKFILGEKDRDLLIEGTEFKNKKVERTQDDQLCKIASNS